MKPTIIIIDDDLFYLEEFEEFLKDEFNVIISNSIQDGLTKIKQNSPDILLLDITLEKGNEGIEFLPEIKKLQPWLPVIMVTNHDSHSLYKKSQEFGAVDYFVKSSNLENLKLLIKSYLTSRNEIKDYEGIIVKSKIMKNVLDKAINVAKYNNTILLIGESGTGKEVISRFIHKKSKYKTGPFYAINCGAINQNILESELFGHEKGAFTGADKSKKGMIELANNGTLFLDEIEDLPLHAQVALLRVLEEKKVYPVGSNNFVNVNFRLIAASKTNLQTLINDKKFREDLYYRIKGYVIQIPPLRERKKDILPLAYYFMKNFCKSNNIPDKIFSQNAINILHSYKWPGNVRELKNAIESSVLNSKSKYVNLNNLKLNNNEISSETINYKIAKNEVIEKFEKKYVKDALLKNDGNITKTAQDMHISRRFLHELLSKYQINENNK